jgi:dihydrofolate reductase
MSRVRVFVATSLDGFLAGPDDELDFLAPGEGTEDTFSPFLEEVGALLMGRRTHDVVAAMPGAPWPYGDRPVLVATSRPLAPARPSVRAVRGPVDDLVAEARRAAGDLDVYLDGGALVRSALEAGLVDELTVTVVPWALGRGRPLLAGLAGRVPLALEGARPIGGGLVQLRYRPLRG